MSTQRMILSSQLQLEGPHLPTGEVCLGQSINLCLKKINYFTLLNGLIPWSVSQKHPRVHKVHKQQTTELRSVAMLQRTFNRGIKAVFPSDWTTATFFVANWGMIPWSVSVPAKKFSHKPLKSTMEHYGTIEFEVCAAVQSNFECQVSWNLPMVPRIQKK